MAAKTRQSVADEAWQLSNDRVPLCVDVVNGFFISDGVDMVVVDAVALERRL